MVGVMRAHQTATERRRSVGGVERQHATAVTYRQPPTPARTAVRRALWWVRASFVEVATPGRTDEKKRLSGPRTRRVAEDCSAREGLDRTKSRGESAARRTDQWP